MANTKKLRANAQKFRKENPNIQAMCTVLIQRMADFIRKTGAPEVTVELKGGYYNEYANN